MPVTRADVSPQRIVQRASGVLSVNGDNTPMRIDVGHAHVISCLIRYTDSGLGNGQYEIAAEVFDGARWKRVTIENVGLLTSVAGAGTSALSGSQTTFDQALKVIAASRGSSEVEYTWAILKRIYAVRFNFIELGDSDGPGTLENIVTISVD